MEFTYATTAVSECMAFAIEVILFLTNFFGKNRKDIKVRVYVASVFFMMIATCLHMFWCFSGNNTHSEFWGKFMLVSTYIFSYIGTAFIGYYLIAVIDSRGKPAHKFYSLMPTVVSLLGIVYVIWGGISSRVFYYQDGKMGYGDMFPGAVYLVVILGAVDVLIIFVYFKRLGVRDALITTAYFMLPILAVSCMIINARVDFIFAAVAISELIVNNMLLMREKSEKAMEATLAKQAADNKS